MSTLAPRRPVHVDAVLTDGSTREIRAHAVRGTADNPMTRPEVEAKAMELMAPVLGRSGARSVCGAVAGLDEVAGIDALMRRLAAD